MTNETSAMSAYSGDTLAGRSPGELIDLLIRDEDRAPRNLIDRCAQCGEAMVEHLRARVDDDRAWQSGVSSGEWWLLLHAAMILGLIPSESAGLLLVRLMRRMVLAGDDNLQDWLAGYWPALFANKPQPPIDAVRELAGDRALYWYIRCQASDVVVDAAMRAGPAPLDRVLDWLAVCIADETEDWDYRISAATALLDFPRGRHRALLDDLAARQGEGVVHFSAKEVEADFAHARDEPGWRRRDEPWRFYAPGVIAARQDRWEEEAARGDGGLADDGDYLDEAPALPYVRPAEKVGRNEPCPCGSGKKYKKCCLPNEQA